MLLIHFLMETESSAVSIDNFCKKVKTMSLFLWKKSYEINIPDIDMQHRRLVGLINELSDAMMARAGQRAAPHILSELVDYIQLHFSEEEKLMEKINFPELSNHRQQHLEFAQQVLDFKERYSSEHVVDTPGLLNFLCDWLKGHILENDKAIAYFIRQAERDGV